MVFAPLSFFESHWWFALNIRRHHHLYDPYSVSEVGQLGHVEYFLMPCIHLSNTYRLIREKNELFGEKTLTV